MSDDVAADGSPTAIYLALPAGDTPALIDDAVRPEGSILELGSGPGRVTNPLVALGRRVVAVESHAPMLEHIVGAETVHDDLFELDLGRQFDGVVAGSHLINQPDRERRARLLDVCRRHVTHSGVVLVERYDPHWASDPQPSQADIGPVHITFTPTAVLADSFDATVTYELGERAWTQTFSGAAVTDAMLEEEAAEHSLRLDRFLDRDHLWAAFTPA